MRHIILTLLLLVAPVAGFASEADSAKAGAAALAFINGYVKASYARGWDSQKFVESSPLVTPNFKRTLKKMIADGFKQDPEVGLGSDPVIAGNDCPERFTLKSAKADGETAAAVLIGPSDYPHQIKVRLVKADGRWLVDACGDMLR